MSARELALVACGFVLAVLVRHVRRVLVPALLDHTAHRRSGWLP